MIFSMPASSFQIDTRLAPPGHLTGQTPGTGIYPAQTDDLKRQILAALADSQCNGSIYLVGGSSGGCLALYVMLDSSTGAVTNWTEAARTSIKAVVSLSGPTRLCNWDNPGMVDSHTFEYGVCDYVGLTTITQDCALLDPASPYTIVSTATSSPPVRLYTTVGDPVFSPQAGFMQSALLGKFGFTFDVKAYTMSYSGSSPYLHAFHYWHAQNDAVTPNVCVSSQVIAFLQSYP